MKKLFTTLAIGALAVVAANAQAVLGYTLSESQGQFTPLTDATVVYDASTMQISSSLARNIFYPGGSTFMNGTQDGFNIGFDARIGDKTYSDFLVSGSGYLYLGNGAISFSAFMQSGFLTSTDGYTCFGLANYKGLTIREDTKISYKASDDKLIVEFANYGINYGYGNGENVAVDYQLVIGKDGDAQLIFGNIAKPGDNDITLDLLIGIAQDKNGVGAVSIDDALVIKTSPGSSDYAKISSATAAGTILTFVAPTDCVKPEKQPTALQLQPTSTEAEGEFTAAESADSYLVVYAADGAATDRPVDGTFYAKDAKLGEATVAYFGPNTKFSIAGLEGGTKYNCIVYAANSFGLNGPVYNEEAPLTASFTTLPAGPQAVSFSAPAIDGFKMAVNSNSSDDEIVIIYTAYCDRSEGNSGVFGIPPANVKAGDVLPVPEGYTPEWGEDVAKPENGGTVAYVGKASDDINITGLQAGTGYFVAVYTRSTDGSFTTSPLFSGYGTAIDNTYDGDSFNFPSDLLPWGWSGTVADKENKDMTVSDKVFRSYFGGEITQGSQYVQQVFTLDRSDADGIRGWLKPAPIVVGDDNLTATFTYYMEERQSYFSSSPYNDWASGDVLDIQVSENGKNWSILSKYDAENHPTEEELGYVDISADLSDYKGKTIELRLYWKTYCTADFGGNLYVDRFSIEKADDPSSAVEIAAGEISVKVLGREIVVAGAEGKIVNIYNTAGMKLASTASATTETYGAAPGVYVVAVDGQSVKVIVK